jgi:hypothetical protein
MDEVRPTATEDNLQEYQRMMQRMQKMEGEEEDKPDYYA